MTSEDFLIALAEITVCTIVSIPFGIWQESVAAGFFMALLIYVVSPRT